MYRLVCVLIAVATVTASRGGAPSVYDDDSRVESSEESEYYDRPTRTHEYHDERPHKHDKDGYTTFLEDGERHGTCKKYKVAGGPAWYSKLPSNLEFYGPHMTEILYISATPSPESDGALVKVLWGGVGHHFALLRFKSTIPNGRFLFNVRVCW